VGYALSPVKITVKSRFSGLGQRVHTVRSSVAERVPADVDGSAGALWAALLTGQRGAIPEEDGKAMRAVGLAHLSTISGLHLGLVMATAFFLVRAAGAAVPSLALRADLQNVAAVAAWLVALVYLLLAGATLPTQRAFMMAGLMLLALFTGRQAISLRLAAFAALAILVLAPEALLSASFQMSFSAVVALVAVYEIAAPRLAAMRRQAVWPRRIALYFLGVLLTTLVAELAIAAFAAFHFNRITTYGVLANLVAVPVMAFWVMRPFGALGDAVGVGGAHCRAHGPGRGGGARHSARCRRLAGSGACDTGISGCRASARRAATALAEPSGRGAQGCRAGWRWRSPRKR